MLVWDRSLQFPAAGQANAVSQVPADIRRGILAVRGGGEESLDMPYAAADDANISSKNSSSFDAAGPPTRHPSGAKVLAAAHPAASHPPPGLPRNGWWLLAGIGNQCGRLPVSVGAPRPDFACCSLPPATGRYPLPMLMTTNQLGSTISSRARMLPPRKRKTRTKSGARCHTTVVSYALVKQEV